MSPISFMGVLGHHCSAPQRSPTSSSTLHLKHLKSSLGPGLGHEVSHSYQKNTWRIRRWICIYIYTYVCMHACMHACMYVGMYVCMYRYIYMGGFDTCFPILREPVPNKVRNHVRFSSPKSEKMWPWDGGKTLQTQGGTQVCLQSC